jgi:hypothetical protein
MSAADEIRAIVREKYAAIARSASRGCCGPRAEGCCADGSLDMIGDSYRTVEGHVAEADLGLGCGVPTRHAALRPGEVVLDLGVARVTIVSSPATRWGRPAGCSASTSRPR